MAKTGLGLVRFAQNVDPMAQPHVGAPGSRPSTRPLSCSVASLKVLPLAVSGWAAPAAERSPPAAPVARPAGPGAPVGPAAESVRQTRAAALWLQRMTRGNGTARAGCK